MGPFRKTTRDAIPRGKRHASSAPKVRTDSANSCSSDAFPTGFGTGLNVPYPSLARRPPLQADPGVGGSPAHIKGAQHVNCRSKCRAIHGCYRRSGGARRCADDVLEVVEMGHIRGVRWPESECCESACRPDAVVVASFTVICFFFHGAGDILESLSQLRIPFPRLTIEQRRTLCRRRRAYHQLGDRLKRCASKSWFCTRARSFSYCSRQRNVVPLDRSCRSRTTHYSAFTGGLMEEGRRVRF